MPSLFNMPTPEEVRANARQEAMSTARLFAGAPAGRGAVLAASQAGGLFGEALARGMGGKLPGEDDAQKFQMVQAKVMQDIDQLQIDPTQPEGFLALTRLTAQYANQAGLPDVAQKAALQGLEIRKSLMQKAPAEDTDSGLYVEGDPESEQFNVVGSGARLKSGKLIADKPDLVERAKRGEIMFVRGDSPLMEKLKSKTGGEAADKITIEAMKPIIDDYNVALRKEPTVQQLVSIVTAPNFNSGRWNDLILPLQEWADEMGIDLPKDAAMLGRADQMLEQLVLDNIGYQKGNLNLAEFESIRKLTGQINNPVDKLRKTALVAQEVINRQKKRMEMADDHRAANKGKLDGFAKTWNNYISSAPMTIEIKKNGITQTLLLPEARAKWLAEGGNLDDFYRVWAKKAGK